MKVALDLDKLRSQGRITPLEYDRLQSFAKEETGSLGLNILIAFGVIATAAGTLAQLHSARAAIVLGLVLGSAGAFLIRRYARAWGILGSILVLVGCLTTAGGIITLNEAALGGYLLVTVLCLVGALVARSGLLASLSALALAGAIGAATDYGHASYFVIVQKPTLTVIVFGLLSWGTYRWSLRLDDAHERLALMFSRTSLFLVNLGFWVGSLWGDTLWSERVEWSLGSGKDIPDWVFVVAWAIALIATGLWALRRNRRWAVNTLTVFGAIHFYTQYFERMHATPSSLIVAGVLALCIALAIARYNRGAQGHPSGQASRAA
jgi:hypothetical protein